MRLASHRSALVKKHERPPSHIRPAEIQVVPGLNDNSRAPLFSPATDDQLLAISANIVGPGFATTMVPEFRGRRTCSRAGACALRTPVVVWIHFWRCSVNCLERRNHIAAHYSTTDAHIYSTARPVDECAHSTVDYCQVERLPTFSSAAGAIIGAKSSFTNRNIAEKPLC